jgi:TonB family protein
MKISLRKSSVGSTLAFALCGLLLAAGCAGNEPKETHPTPDYSPITVTNPPIESKPASITNLPPPRRLSRRERPQSLADAKVGRLYQPKQKLSDYDKAFVDSVREHWYEMLDNSSYRETTNGKVTLEFRLLRDGSISDIKVVKTSVNPEMTALCRQTLLNAAPFPPWPRSMRLQTGKDERTIQFDFDFN